MYKSEWICSTKKPHGTATVALCCDNQAINHKNAKLLIQTSKENQSITSGRGPIGNRDRNSHHI